MEIEPFKGSKGRVEISGTGYFYFVPPEIPRKLDFHSAVVNLLSPADQHLGHLASLGKVIPDPKQFIYPYMVREAVLSSRIEGTQATESDVFLKEAIRHEKVGRPMLEFPADLIEVQNYVKAQEFGQRAIKDRGIDLNLICELHGILLKGVRGETKDPGRFRTGQNWIGAEGAPLEQATYVPPEPRTMKKALLDLERFLRAPPDLPVLLQAALLHYQFEAIHPFRDGNGRIGRLLVSLWLLKRGVLREPLLYLSAHFERSRNAYYESLLRVSQGGDYDQWFVFFLQGVIDEAQDASARAHKLLSLREKYRTALQDHGATASALKILDDLFRNPYLTAPFVARRLDASFPTALRTIAYLENAKIVNEFTGGKRDRIYVAQEILSILGRPAIKRSIPEKGQRQLPLSS